MVMNIRKAPLLFIVDDDQDDKSLLEVALRKFLPAAVFDAFSDGREVVQRLQTSIKRLPDLIILDLNMPVMNGYDVLRWVRANTMLSELPVVIFTTSRATEDIRSCRNLGANDYLSKPADLEGYEHAAALIFKRWFGTLETQDVQASAR